MADYGTPLNDALGRILAEGRAPFHMPGHKGKLPFPLSEAAPYDVTEIPGADSLYEAQGPLYQLELRIAAAYRAGASLLSAGGSSLCIQAMLYLARRRGRKLIVARNAHRSAVSAMGLLGIDPIWVPCRVCYDDEYGIDGVALPPDVEVIERLLEDNPDTAAVYVTSPDYFGQMADVPAISELCRRYGAWLLVDNAHGAHLSRFRAALHPMQLGADLCCDSLHKTLPVLTGGAALHLADPDLYGDAKYAMSLFGSTSPSYLIMLSVDMALAQMESGGDELLRLGGYIGALKERLTAHGYQTIRRFVCDPIRLTVGFAPMGYTGGEMSQYLRARGVEPEYISDTVAIFMPSENTTPEELSLLERLLLQLPARPALSVGDATGRLPRQPLGLGEAMNRPQLLLPTERTEGRISGRLYSRCPPGTPVVVPGEEITRESINALKTSGIDYIYVVK